MRFHPSAVFNNTNQRENKGKLSSDIITDSLNGFTEMSNDVFQQCIAEIKNLTLR